MVDKQQILKTYLGDFYGPPIRDENIIAKIHADVHKPKLYTWGYILPTSELQPIVQALVLLFDKRITYIVAESYRDITERYIKGLNRESEPEFQDFSGYFNRPELLIIYRPINCPVNKQMIPFCQAIAESRTLVFKKTCFLAFNGQHGFTGFEMTSLYSTRSSGTGAILSAVPEEIL
jgi:hypothetical protein